jgi:hypothetical protein
MWGQATVFSPDHLLDGRNSGVGIEPGFAQETHPDRAVRTIRDRFSYLPAGLMNLCQVAGLDVQDVRACWKREYLSAVAIRAPASSRRRRRFATASLKSLQSFRAEWARTVEQWQARLAAWRRSGVHVVAWGAWARAVTFFGNFDCRGLIDVVIDINPIRRGKYLPVSALRVEAPSFIRRFKPAVILITNPTYKSEIQAHVARLGVRCAFDQL